MRKLIDFKQKDLIICDNKDCDFKIINESEDPNADISMFVNANCPKCDENLLTEKDYKESLSYMKTVNMINKYFSWLTIFYPKPKGKEKITVHIHNGIKIENNE